MKTTLRTAALRMTLAIAVALFITPVCAQIPNWGFESWTTHNMDLPTGWTVFGSATKAAPGASGNYCVRLSADPMNPNENIGAIIYGTPQDQGLNFSGGIPFAGRPDSIKVNMKYQIATGDSAWILVLLKKNNVQISFEIFKITGTQSTFATRAFPITYFAPGNSDSLIIAFTSSDPMSSIPNPTNFVFVDDITFTGTTATVPNGDMESWMTQTFFTADGWGNASKNLTDSTLMRTTDASGGAYALKVQTYILQGDTRWGIASTVKPGGMPGFNFGPTFPVMGKPDTLTGWYKYDSQYGDSCHVQVNMFQTGVMIGYGQFMGINASTYTPFKCGIMYNMGTPDSATITVSTFPLLGQPQPKGPATLYIDNLNFDQLINLGMEERSPVVNDIRVYPNPTANHASVNFNLGNRERVVIHLTDLTGNEVMPVLNQQLEQGGYNYAFDVNTLAPGMYLLKLETGSSMNVSKILVTK